MSCQKLFVDQYNANYNEENWFPTIQKALAGLTLEQANRKEGTANHSIQQLVNHLIFWNERYLLRFTERPLSEMKKSEEDVTFEIDVKEWDKTLVKLNSVMTELGDVIKNADEEKLQSSPFKDSDDSWYSVISNINIHNAYHIGQIIYIRKQQGSWESEKSS
ncbi:MAG: DinB family protein [bacterium]